MGASENSGEDEEPTTRLRQVYQFVLAAPTNSSCSGGIRPSRRQLAEESALALEWKPSGPGYGATDTFLTTLHSTVSHG